MVRKVLFVDDDQIMLLAIEKRFAAYSDSFSMIMAHDGFDAIQKLKETSVSLIVLDLKMPRMDGMSLLSHTREKYPDIPVIIVSGYRTAEMYKLAKAKGVIAYISKPFQVDDLGKIIMSTMQKEAAGGIMHNVSPTVFLQLMEMEAKTCTIRILDKVSQKGGILYFEDGQLLDARIGELTSINAAYRVFSWDEVTIFIQNESAPRENKINSDLQPIIMKAVGMKDESDESFMEEEATIEEVGTSSPLMEATDEEEISSSLMEVTEEEEEASPLMEATEELPDLDIPDEFIEPSFYEDVEEQAIEKEKIQPIAEKNSTLDEIRHLLYQQVGKRCGLEDIYHDETMGNVIEFLTELGGLFDFGKLKVGYIDNGKETDRIILPGSPSTILKVSPKCPQDKMLKVLSDYSN